MGAEYVAVMDHHWSVAEILRLPDRLKLINFQDRPERAGGPRRNKRWVLDTADRPSPPLKQADLWYLVGPAPLSLIVGRRSMSMNFGCKVGSFLRNRGSRYEFRDAARRLAQVAGTKRTLFMMEFNAGVDWDLVAAGKSLAEIEGWLRNDGIGSADWQSSFTCSTLDDLAFIPPYFVDDRQ